MNISKEIKSLYIIKSIFSYLEAKKNYVFPNVINFYKKFLELLLKIIKIKVQY